MLLFILFSLTSFAHAAPVFTWAECVALASEKNPSLAAGHYQLSASEAKKKAAISAFLPSVSGSLSWNRSGVQREGQGFTTLSNTGDSYSAGLNASMNLFAGLKDKAKVDQADFNIEASKAQLQTTKAQISFDLKSAYEGLLYALSYQTLTQEIIKRREENLKMVQLRFQSGLENKGSFLLSEAYLAQARYDDLQAQNAARVARAQLARTLGIDDQEEFLIEGEVPQDSPDVRPNFRELALSTPTYLASRSVADAAKEDIIIARANFLPSLSLSGEVRRQDENFWPEQQKQWGFGVTLSMPFFDGGRDWYSTKAASQTYLSRVEERTNVGRDVIAKLERAWASFQEAASKLTVDRTFRDAAVVRAEISRKKYNNGLLTFENWDIIENDLINRQKSYLSTKRDRVTAEASWEQTLGQGVLP